MGRTLLRMSRIGSSKMPHKIFSGNGVGTAFKYCFCCCFVVVSKTRSYSYPHLPTCC